MIRYLYILFACFFVQLSVCMKYQQSEFRESVSNKLAQPLVNQDDDWDDSDLVPLGDTCRQPSILNLKRMITIMKQNPDNCSSICPAIFKSEVTDEKNNQPSTKVMVNVHHRVIRIPRLKIPEHPISAAFCRQQLAAGEKVEASPLFTEIDKKEPAKYEKKLKADLKIPKLPRSKFMMFK